MLPAAPVDGDEPADRCGGYFTAGDGKEWLDHRFEEAEHNLEVMFERIDYFSPAAKAVLVGYPRLVPANVVKCQTPAPGQAEKPLADIPVDALQMFDKVQERLNDLMRTRAAEAGGTFVDLYTVTGGNTACDGADRGIGGLFEGSQVEFGDDALPWYLHPNTRGRDIQAHHVTTAIQHALGT
ncbi:hypothetical protein [Amycolatopsis magusensis]|uniref:hypothetical protein n=1 Tax=Amycolatopsis magusensis TaxID=882444 RepID=UPI00378AB1E4